MVKQRSTKRTLDDWLNGPVTQRIRTVSDNSTSDNVEDKDQEPCPSHSQEPCTIVKVVPMMEKLMMKLKVTVTQKWFVLKAKRYLHPVLGVHWPSQYLLTQHNSYTNTDCIYSVYVLVLEPIVQKFYLGSNKNSPQPSIVNNIRVIYRFEVRFVSLQEVFKNSCSNTE